MQAIKKQIVTDESMRPVAVIINYEDWQAIEKILETYQQQTTAPSLAIFAGAIELSIDPLEYQQHIREEWT